MLALTLLTALNTFNGGFLVASRFIYAAAREGNLPRAVRAAEPEGGAMARRERRSRASRRLVAALVFATGEWLMLVAVGAAIEAGIYALASRVPADPAPARDPRAPVPLSRRDVRWRPSAW